MNTVLSDLSAAMAARVELAGSAVVRVNGRRGVPASGIIWSGDGEIVTASHVVRREEDLRVGLPDGREVDAKLIGRDHAADIAVLRASATGLKAPTWLPIDEARVGQLVLALGRPGRTVQATLGVVSALGSEWRTPEGGLVDRYLQTDVVMYPGFSGGPLVGADGRFVGMNTSGLSRGVSLTLPAVTLQRIVPMLVQHGHVRRGYLGIGAQPVRLPEEVAGQLGQETGVLLMSVEPGAPAAMAGLALGDTLVTLEGAPIRHMDDVQAALGGDRIGSTLGARFLRGGKLHDVHVTVGERA
jgi:S1-C subfamily serine protease